MNKGLLIGSLVVALGAGGVIVGTMGDDAGPGEGLENVDGGIVEEPGEVAAALPVRERDAVQVIYGSRDDKPLRLVGSSERGAEVVDSEVGRVTELDHVPADALCPVLFEAPVQVVDGYPFPRLAQFDNFVGREMRPVQIPGSARGQDWVWFTYLKGSDCVEMARYGSFLGSDLQSIMKLPLATQRRILRAEVEGEAVPIDDPRVNEGSTVFLPVALAGRDDLNFVSRRGGKVESRTAEPADGWDKKKRGE